VPLEPPPAVLPEVAEPAVVIVKVVVLGTEVIVCSIFNCAAVIPSVVVRLANVTKSPVIAPCAACVVTVTTPLPAPPVVFTGFAPRLTVDLMGVMSLKVPAFSKKLFVLCL
jgi:hypothetical protein